MTITRIGETQAKPETTEALRDFLISIMPMIKSSQGCESVTLYQSHDDPTKFTMIEIWDSLECLVRSGRCWRPRPAGCIMSCSTRNDFFKSILNDSYEETAWLITPTWSD